MKEGRLRRSILLAYGAPTFAEQLMVAPIWGILPALYAEHTTVTLAAIGGVFLIARLLDAITDPLVGYLSDITVSRFGPRKPWIAGGAVVSALGVVFFYTPSPTAGAASFLGWSAVVFLGWTMLVVPYNAWATELTGDYHDRARLFAYRNTIGGVGALLFIISPLVLKYWTGNTEFTLELMGIMTIVLVIVLPLTVGTALYVVPQGETLSIDRPSIRGLVDSLRRNRVMWLFISITFISGIAQSAMVSLQFLFVDNYLELGASYAMLGAVQMVTYVASIPIWLRSVKRFGKHRPWAAASFSLVLTGAIAVFLEPGPGALIPLVAWSILVGFFNAAHAVSPQSILTDVIDYDTLKTGVNRAGNYFSFLMLLSKGTTAVGSGLALGLVGLAGYDPKGAHDAAGVMGLLIVFAAVPAVLGVINGGIILKYPLDERRQEIIRRRIEQRAERLARATPQPASDSL
jgi:Na+/melibiose symporter-like transporter